MPRAARPVSVVKVIVVAGALAFVLGLHTVWFIGSAHRAPGTIAEIGPCPNYGLQSRDSCMLVRFTTLDGKVMTLRRRAYHYHPDHVGEAVGVYYQPSNPSGAKLDRFEELWMWPGLILAVAVAGLAQSWWKRRLA